MTRLSSPAIAALARANDLAGPDVVTAIATALAASGGDAAYHHVVRPGPAADYRGLWGLDVVDWPEYAGADLFHPEVAARICAQLVRNVGAWTWCPSYRAAAHRRHVEAATPAASMLPGPQRHDTDIIGDVLEPDLARTRARLAVLTDRTRFHAQEMRSR